MDNKPEYYLTKYLQECAKSAELQCFVELVAADKQPDGTYQFCHETLKEKAKNLLNILKINGYKPS